MFIAAAAIHSVLHPEVSVVTLNGREVIEALVERELGRLANQGTQHGLNEHVLGRLSAFAAIRDGLDANTLRRLAEPGLELGLPAGNQAVDAIALTQSLVDNRIPAPEPDILASSNPAALP